jgi:hypothetical protein
MTYKSMENYILVHKNKVLILFSIQDLTGCGFKMMIVQIAQQENGIDSKIKKVPLSLRKTMISS